MNDRSYRRATDLMEANLGDELVALDPAKGNCFGFNEIATWVWHRLEQPASFDELRDGLLNAYEVSDEQCTRELQELLDDLSSKGLVTTAR